jgi:hypothetical protein
MATASREQPRLAAALASARMARKRFWDIFRAWSGSADSSSSVVMIGATSHR